MDLWLLIQAFIMGLVEGITEFLPISSTGHLIITAALLDFWTKEKRDVFEVAIQLGAILSVCYEYRERLFKVITGLLQNKPEAWRFSINVAVAFLPAAILGFLTIHAIKEHLFNAVTVAIALIVGGVIILWAEKREHTIRIHEVDDMTASDAFKVGLAQCAALIPGTSRSGATIIGGLLFGLSRKVAAEFSFFLAIPTMFAATFYDVYKNRDVFEMADMPVFAVGFVVSFVSALLVIRALMRYISKHDFTIFAYYRIVFGLFILATAGFGLITWSH
ncbi:MAG: undecaprenyl-diphosphate phosphatase [Pseudomonadales bacterium]|nr:undecaprenyl-diphosphate phosphatase [Pseudomonadales bacterium]